MLIWFRIQEEKTNLIWYIWHIYLLIIAISINNLCVHNISILSLKSFWINDNRHPIIRKQILNQSTQSSPNHQHSPHPIINTLLTQSSTQPSPNHQHTPHSIINTALTQSSTHSSLNHQHSPHPIINTLLTQSSTQSSLNHQQTAQEDEVELVSLTDFYRVSPSSTITETKSQWTIIIYITSSTRMLILVELCIRLHT